MTFKDGDIVIIDASDTALHRFWNIELSHERIHQKLAVILDVKYTFWMRDAPCIRVGLLENPSSRWALPESMLSHVPIQQRVILEAMHE